MTAAMNANALPVSFRSVVKHYGAVRALDDVSFDVSPGEFVTLLGPSGSGKTTLLMAIAGFVRPDGGSIAIGGSEIVRLPPHKRNIGMVFQNYALFPHMTAGENIGYPLRLRGHGKAESTARVREVLDLVRLAGFEERRISQLSGGQRQRVALARAIVFKPRILLMDEPLSALDKQLREKMQIEIRSLHDRLGTTTIAVTHDQREALTMSDRVAILHQGRLRQFDTPRRLYDNPASRFVAEFIGESSFIPVNIDASGAVYAGSSRLRMPGGARDAGRALLLIRPEKLVLGHQLASADANRFAGTVKSAVFQGDSVLMSVILEDGHEIQTRFANRDFESRALPAEGSRVEVGLSPADTLLIPDEASR